MVNTTEKAYGLNLFRGIGWLAVAVAGAWFIGSGGFAAMGMNEYVARWIGVCFKVGTGAWGGYRISRDVLKIDPSAVAISGNAQAYALMHLARAVIVGIIILSVTQGS